jgi:hypothetical protein
MIGARGDYRSYLLRLYRVRKGGESSWRASLHAPQGGEPLHFAGLSELVAFLEQEDDPANGVGAQGRAEEPTAGEEDDLGD